MNDSKRVVRCVCLSCCRPQLLSSTWRLLQDTDHLCSFLGLYLLIRLNSHSSCPCWLAMCSGRRPALEALLASAWCWSRSFTASLWPCLQASVRAVFPSHVWRFTPAPDKTNTEAMLWFLEINVLWTQMIFCSVNQLTPAIIKVLSSCPVIILWLFWVFVLVSYHINLLIHVMVEY